MAIKIKKQETFIPIEVGDVKLKFDYNDNSLTEVRTELLKTQKKIGRIEGDEMDEKAVEDAKEILTEAMDAMFGEGAFEKLYEMTPSIIVVLEYFSLMVDGITEELRKKGLETDIEQRQNKYLNKE